MTKKSTRIKTNTHTIKHLHAYKHTNAFILLQCRKNTHGLTYTYTNTHTHRDRHKYRDKYSSVQPENKEQYSPTNKRRERRSGHREEVLEKVVHSSRGIRTSIACLA